MKYRLIKEYNTSNWSGGTTTELFIYPENSNYTDRNFDFRISSAIIDLENSKFTPLPDYNRILMILGSPITIFHKDKYKKKLNKFEQDQFHGSFETTSIGKTKDFNLMMKDNYLGEIKHIIIKGEYETVLNADFTFIYVFSGSINIDNINVNENESIMIENEKHLKINSVNDSNIILTNIKRR